MRRKKKMDVHASLNQKTLAFWELSRRIRGHDKIITVDTSIKQTNELMYVLNPQRPLWKAVAEIQHQVIEHGGVKRAKKKNQSNVLKLISR